MIIVLVILAIIIIFLAILLIRAAMFTPGEELKPSEEKVYLNEDRIVSDLAEMIRCKTVSYNDDSLIDKAEFKKFQDLLPELYPLVHGKCPREFVGVNGMLYHWKGKTSEEPVVLMAHYDVVPVEETQWDKPAFEGIVEDERNILRDHGSCGKTDRGRFCPGTRHLLCVFRAGRDKRTVLSCDR